MKRIHITGPESCGKTELAGFLLSELRGAFVHEEYARIFLEAQHPVGHYDRAILQQIATEQIRRWEFIPEEKEWIIFDSDPLVLKIWVEEVYGETWPEIEAAVLSFVPDITLLCSPDIPWKPDPLRSNPNDRDRLFQKYRQLLNGLQRPYLLVEGTGEERHLRPLASIRAVLAVNQAKQ